MTAAVQYAARTSLTSTAFHIYMQMSAKLRHNRARGVTDSGRITAAVKCHEPRSPSHISTVLKGRN